MAIQFYENKDKDIECPVCKSFLTKADSRDDRVHKLACRKCQKWIWFTPKTDEMEIHKIPSRPESSGLRFY